MLLLLAACETEPPAPSEGMTDTETPDMGPALETIVGANFADPNTTSQCTILESCAPLDGEPTDALTAGTCQETHLRVFEDGRRQILDELTRKTNAKGRVTSITQDRRVTTFTYSAGRLTRYQIAAPGSNTPQVTHNFVYDFSGLLTSHTLFQGSDSDNPDVEASWTYDAQQRVSGVSSKVRNAMGGFTRRSALFQYPMSRVSESWVDEDLDGTISTPDSLIERRAFNDDGQLVTFEQFTNPETGSAEPLSEVEYNYDDQERPIEITRLDTDAPYPLQRFTYDDQGRPTQVELDVQDGQSARLELTRDDDSGELTRALIFERGATSPRYEITFEGRSCERTLNTWVATLQDGLSAN